MESGVYTLGVESKLVTDVSGIVEMEPIPADSDPGSIHTDLHKTIRDTNSSCEPHFSVLTPPSLICNKQFVYLNFCHKLTNDKHGLYGFLPTIAADSNVRIRTGDSGTKVESNAQMRAFQQL